MVSNLNLEFYNIKFQIQDGSFMFLALIKNIVLIKITIFFIVSGQIYSIKILRI